jgi:hypothetical protein
MSCMHPTCIQLAISSLFGPVLGGVLTLRCTVYAVYIQQSQGGYRKSSLMPQARGVASTKSHQSFAGGAGRRQRRVSGCEP